MPVSTYGFTVIPPGQRGEIFDPRGLEISFPQIRAWAIGIIFPTVDEEDGSVSIGMVGGMVGPSTAGVTLFGAFDTPPDPLGFATGEAYILALDAWFARNATVPLDRLTFTYSDTLNTASVVVVEFEGTSRPEARAVAENWSWQTVLDLNPTYDATGGAPPGGIFLEGTPDNDRLFGGEGDDSIYGDDGSDTISGGAGDDFLFGGASERDLRDVIFGGDGNDSIDGNWGNDELNGGEGNDTILGGFGADTLIGNAGDDLLAGGAGADLMFGGPGNDTLNGGFGFDRLNGGAGADRLFHAGVADHASDWIQDYNAAEGDLLVFGLAGATRAQFQVNTTTTPGAGSADVEEAFVIYRPTGQIMWALVDGDAQTSINLLVGGQVYDLLA